MEALHPLVTWKNSVCSNESPEDNNEKKEHCSHRMTLPRIIRSVPRTPQQNGIVERRNRTLVEAARTMLIFSKAPMFLWAEAVATACYTQNRSLIHTRHNKTPIEDLGKFQAKADIGIFVVKLLGREGL
ncbi:retrovirus-related pol polyprotein from transposon TNT 1-94 [Tanacetum coccineum]